MNAFNKSLFIIWFPPALCICGGCFGGCRIRHLGPAGGSVAGLISCAWVTCNCCSARLDIFGRKLDILGSSLQQLWILTAPFPEACFILVCLFICSVAWLAGLLRWRLFPLECEGLVAAAQKLQPREWTRSPGWRWLQQGLCHGLLPRSLCWAVCLVW